jgi:amidase
MGASSTARDYVLALEVIADAYAPVGEILTRHDLLICPTLGVPGLPAAYDSTRDQVRINGQVVSPFLGWALTVPFNMLSRLPVLAVPSGFTSNGVPSGIQIVGRSYSDRDVFRAGMAYEGALGGWFGRGARPAV